MEDLLRGLRNLGLQAPNPAQLWQLLDDDVEVQRRLIKLLAFNVSRADEQDDTDGDGGFAAALMGQDLLQEAVSALLDNFRRAIERQRLSHRPEDENLQKGISKKVKLPPRKALVARFDAALRKDEEERRACPGYRPRLVYDGNTAFHSQRETLDELKAVRAVDLSEAPKRYEGTYLVGRVFTPLLLYVGVTFLIEDVDENLIPVSVSHFTDDLNADTAHISSYLPEGTLIAIKEPFLSLDHQARAGPCTGRADVGIRVDSPTDVLVLPDDAKIFSRMSQLPESVIAPDDLPWLGVDTGRNNIEFARRLYGVGRFGAAYRSIRQLRKAGELSDVELEARTLFALGRFNEAQPLYEGLMAIKEGCRAHDEKKAADFATSIDVLTPAQAAIRCRLRFVQETQGLSVDDVRSIYFASSDTPRLDTADYIGPVEVKSIEGEGRGLVTTRDVEPGEQLLCCRAVNAAYPDDRQSQGSPLLRLNLDNGVVAATTQVRAQTRLIHAIVDRPELALPILGLTAGPKMAYSEYVARPYPLRNTVSHQDEPTQLINAIDAAYIDGVLRFNAFGPAQSPARRSSANSVQDFGELSKSTMPHPLPAILNHACLPNVASIFFSDIVTTRALMKLPKGTQIVHQYVRGEEPYAIRAAQLSKHGFECACQLCTLDRQDGKDALDVRARIIQGELRAVEERSRVLLKRVNLTKLGSDDAMKSVADGRQPSDEDLDAHRDVLASLVQLVDRVNRTYAQGRGPLRPDVFVVLEIMVTHLALLDFDRATDAVVEAVKAVGGRLEVGREAASAPEQGYLEELPRLHIDRVIGLLLLLAVVNSNRGHKEVSLLFVQSAFWSHQCMIGGGLAVFRDRWRTKEYESAVDLFTPL
jgi:hypothetical protein